MIAIFFMYDVVVQRRNNSVVANAARSNAIVTSLFPGNIRDRLIGKEASCPTNQNLMTFMSNGVDEEAFDHNSGPSKPLADLFLESTVMFADIVGFTAWSSVREPTQVFTLLETVYSAFDAIARRRRIFKVETVGDCYVAVAGLPDYRRDHAFAMLRFARDIMNRMKKTVKKLELTLGPDTGELDLRIGIHSGPVTAGVLRGERARFQLCTLMIFIRIGLTLDMNIFLTLFALFRSWRHNEHVCEGRIHWHARAYSGVGRRGDPDHPAKQAKLAD